MSREVRGAQEPRGFRRFVPRANTRALHPEPRLSSGGDVGISLTGRTCEHLRRHARTLDASGAVIPYKAERELPATTHLRVGARAHAPNTRPSTCRLTPTLDRTAEHHFHTSRTRSTAPCTGRSRDRGFPLAEVCEYPRSHRRLHPHGHYPGFASPSCPVPMHRLSSCPGRAAGGARFPGSPCDMTETAERHDPGGAIQSLRGRKQRHGLATGRLVA